VREKTAISLTCIIDGIIAVAAKVMVADVSIGDQLLDAVEGRADDLGRLALAGKFERQEERFHLGSML